MSSHSFIIDSTNSGLVIVFDCVSNQSPGEQINRLQRCDCDSIWQYNHRRHAGTGHITMTTGLLSFAPDQCSPSEIRSSNGYRWHSHPIFPLSTHYQSPTHTRPYIMVISMYAESKDFSFIWSNNTFVIGSDKHICSPFDFVLFSSAFFCSLFCDNRKG